MFTVQRFRSAAIFGELAEGGSIFFKSAD